MVVASIHPDLEPSLSKFVHELETSFGRDLLSICVFGSAAQGEFQVGLTEVNLMVVLRQVGASELRKLVPPIQAARKEFFLDPLVFTMEDLRTSTDVFPLRILQIRRAYGVLAGQDFINALFVNPEHTRLACEREVKATFLRLRQLYLVRAGLRPAMQEALVDSIQLMVRILGFALELTGHELPTRTESVLEAAKKIIGVEQSVMLRVLLLRLSGEKLEHSKLEELFVDYLGNVEKLARYIDRLS